MSWNRKKKKLLKNMNLTYAGLNANSCRCKKVKQRLRVLMGREKLCQLQARCHCHLKPAFWNDEWYWWWFLMISWMAIKTREKLNYRCWDFPLHVVFVLLLLAVPMPCWLQICELAATMCLKRIAGINVVTPLFTWLPCRLQVAMRIGDAYRDIENN